MDFIRIGDKLIDRRQIIRRIDDILKMRSTGKSQQDTANTLKVDRSFVSRLEALGHVRKGDKAALVGFPVKNKIEIQRIAEKEGIDYVLLFTEVERRAYAKRTAGAQLINELMRMTADLKTFDAVVFLGSDMRIELVEAMIGPDVLIPIELGPSPIEEDVWVDPDEIIRILRGIKR